MSRVMRFAYNRIPRKPDIKGQMYITDYPAILPETEKALVAAGFYKKAVAVFITKDGKRCVYERKCPKCGRYAAALQKVYRGLQNAQCSKCGKVRLKSLGVF